MSLEVFVPGTNDFDDPGSMLHDQVESLVCNADHCKLRAATGASQLKSLVPGSELKMMKAGPYGVVSSPSQPFRGRVGPRSVLSFRRNAARSPASLFLLSGTALPETLQAQTWEVFQTP